MFCELIILHFFAIAVIACFQKFGRQLATGIRFNAYPKESFLDPRTYFEIRARSRSILQPSSRFFCGLQKIGSAGFKTGFVLKFNLKSSKMLFIYFFRGVGAHSWLYYKS